MTGIAQTLSNPETTMIDRYIHITPTLHRRLVTETGS
jgi:hypothetical protein